LGGIILGGRVLSMSGNAAQAQDDTQQDDTQQENAAPERRRHLSSA
jgi:hypothetical protein